ncbi:MAG: hypothetical protein HY046_10445 [Acidobacteria bacterium]|nr:hypothetical protein [Acidobacteriota bacterium]
MATDHKKKILKLLQTDSDRLFTDDEICEALNAGKSQKDRDAVVENLREMLRSGEIRRFKQDDKMVTGLRQSEKLALRPKDKGKKEEPGGALAKRDTVEVTVRPEEALAVKDFSEKAREVMMEFYGRPLKPRKIGGTKIWDYVSTDGMVVGDARWFGSSVPAARAFISEAVWLLEKVGAVQKFVVFGGETEVPRQWLELWATLCPEDIALFYLDGKGDLHEL